MGADSGLDDQSGVWRKLYERVVQSLLNGKFLISFSYSVPVIVVVENDPGSRTKEREEVFEDAQSRFVPITVNVNEGNLSDFINVGSERLLKQSGDRLDEGFGTDSTASIEQ